MKAKSKKKPLTLKQATSIISENIWSFLKTLPAEERKRRLERFHKSVRAKVAQASSARAVYFFDTEGNLQQLHAAK